MSASIFLSHSSADKEFVRKLFGDLRKRRIKVWFDEAEIRPGDSLIQKIEQGIDDMDFLGVVLSRRSVESEWVLREVRQALTQEIRGRAVKVIPLIIDKCSVPGFLRDKKYIDLRDRSDRAYREAIGSLVRAVRNKNQKLPQSNRLQFIKRLDHVPQNARIFDDGFTKELAVALSGALTSDLFDALRDLRGPIDLSHDRAQGIVRSLALERIGGQAWAANGILENLLQHGFLRAARDPAERENFDPGYEYTQLFWDYTNLMVYLQVENLRVDKHDVLGGNYWLSPPT